MLWNFPTLLHCLRGGSGQRIRCECGKEYTVFLDPNQPTSIRCHMCSRLIDVSFVKAAAREAAAIATENEAVARTRAQTSRIEQAQAVHHGGLCFDGMYRTSSPVAIEGSYNIDAFELAFRFAGELLVDYSIRALQVDDDGVLEVEDDFCGQAIYEVANDKVIRFSMNTRNWECTLEGAVRRNTLVLAYRIDESIGLFPVLTGVFEGEATLEFVPGPVCR
jgi:hypothetical protein